MNNSKNFGCKVNQIDSIITITKAFAQKASILGTPEYNILKELRNDFPTFKVELLTIKKNPRKVSYKGLTVANMKAYINECYPNKVDEFDQIQKMAKITNGNYAYIKAWFLKTFPNYKTEALPTDVGAKLSINTTEAA